MPGMVFVPTRKVCHIYGAGKCVRHLGSLPPVSGVGVLPLDKKDEKQAEKIAKHKPQMDNVIHKLAQIRTIKRKKITFKV